MIGIFEDHYLRKKPLPVVKPGTQTRRFTHIDDTIKMFYLNKKKNLNRHYIIANTKSYSIYQVAKLFNKKIRYNTGYEPQNSVIFLEQFTPLKLSMSITLRNIYFI